jgi:hypothetical protein
MKRTTSRSWRELMSNDECTTTTRDGRIERGRLDKSECRSIADQGLESVDGFSHRVTPRGWKAGGKLKHACIMIDDLRSYLDRSNYLDEFAATAQNNIHVPLHSPHFLVYAAFPMSYIIAISCMRS